MELVYLHFNGSSLPRETISVTADILEKWQRAGDLEQYQLEQSENDRSYELGADFEKNLMRIVENGEIDSLKSLLSGPTPDYAEISSLSPEEEKTSEYLVVSVITMVTRAAVAGGAPLEIAHELGDVYLKRLAKAVLHHEAFLGLSYNAMLEFTELVKRAKEEKSGHSYIDACKEYIEKNLRKNLQVGDIAPAIGLSPDLSLPAFPPGGGDHRAAVYPEGEMPPRGPDAAVYRLFHLPDRPVFRLFLPELFRRLLSDLVRDDAERLPQGKSRIGQRIRLLHG
jgi:hypothetical protein